MKPENDNTSDRTGADTTTYPALAWEGSNVQGVMVYVSDTGKYKYFLAGNEAEGWSVTVVTKRGSCSSSHSLDRGPHTFDKVKEIAQLHFQQNASGLGVQ